MNVYIPHHRGTLRFKAGNTGDVPPNVANRGREATERAGNIVERDLEGDGIGGGWSVLHAENIIQ